VHPGAGPLETTAPHQVWCADFKGEFRLGNGKWCYPLTISDAHTRYLLACYALPATAHAGAAPCFAQTFAEYGLPAAIRTDNGVPFSSQALCGLSRLSVEWVRLGIHHQRIAPGHPEQNGRHERMHRTLKAETTRPPAGDLAAQQERFDAFRQDFNEERPHEALGQIPPAALHTPSPRPLPETVVPPAYPGHFEVRIVQPGGTIAFQRHFLPVSQLLRGEMVGLVEAAEGIWSVFYYDLLLGRFHEGDLEIR
jgi:transposase InsO family protein